MSIKNEEFLDFKEWELLEYLITIDDVNPPKIVSEDIKTIKISRDSTFKIKALFSGEMNGLSKVSNEKGKPGEIVRSFVLEGQKYPGIKRYRLEQCYIGEIKSTYNTFENKHTYNGELITFKVKEICSENNVDVLLDWFINGPKNSFVFPRATKRTIKKSINRIRIGIDSETENIRELESESSNRDFAYVDTGGLKFIVSSVPKHYAPDWSEKIGVEYRYEWGIPSEDVRTAINEFVSFLFGKHLLQVGTTKLDEQGYVVEREAITPWGENVVALCQKSDNNPIDFTYKNWGMFEQICNQLLPKYLELRDTLDLSNALWKYWVAGNLPIGTNLPLLSSAIEGIAKNWFKTKKSKTRGVYVDSKIFKKLVNPEMESIIQKLSEIENGNKIINKINSSYNMGANDRLNFFFEEINISVGEAEKEALKARNAMAHGDATSSEETFRFIKLTRIYETFFHRVFLRILGYEGDYIDRGTLGFPNRNIDKPCGEI